MALDLGAPQDLASVPGDLAQLGCHGAIGCILLAKSEADEKACLAATKPMSLLVVGAVFECVNRTCSDKVDGGAPCMNAGDTSLACKMCKDQATKAGGNCAGELATCLGDMP
jgi:hypothetical protein